MKEKDDDEEIINSKMIFLNEKFDIELCSDFNSFINNICNIFKIPKEEFNSLSISYNDEDDDKIIISTEEDYSLYLGQVKDKLVNEIKVEIKEGAKIDKIKCLNYALNYQSNIDKSNNNNMIKNNNIKNNYNDIDDNYINNNMINDEIDNKIENNNKNYHFDIFNQNNHNYINDNYINNDIDNDIFNYFDNDKQNNNMKDKEEPINNDAQIDDIVFDYKCSSCSTYPIIFSLHYCPKCQFHICEDCIEKYGNHEHPFQKYVSKRDLMQIKENENFGKVEMVNNKDNQIENNYINVNNNINPNLIGDDIYNNNNFYNNENYNNQNPNLINNDIGNNNKFNLLEMLKSIPNPFKFLRDERMKKLFKKNKNALKSFVEKIPYGYNILKARYQYNLEGVDDKKLLEVLKKTNGNIDEAVILLTK